MPPDPQIAHLDLDCFFVSVERINDPSLIGKPVAVGGSPQGRGVVTSASYEARAFGVRSAMPAAQALRLCPKLILVRGHHRQYGDISDRLYRRMTEVAPVVERASIDEMYLDLTGTESLHPDGLPAFMHDLQRLVRTEFSLPSTIALSVNKLVSKIAANTVKPDGVITVPPGDEGSFLAPLPVGVIPGVGKKTDEFLRARGIRTVADVQARTMEEMMKLMGRHGVWLHNAAHGRGSTHVSAEQTRKSISREETFGEDIGDLSRLEKILHELTTSVCSTLRRKGFRARTVGVKLRYADFRTVTRDRSIDPTNSDVEVMAAATDLLRRHFDRTQKLRLIGVRLSSLLQTEQLELDLFGRGEKDALVLHVVDSLRERYGSDIISIGRKV